MFKFTRLILFSTFLFTHLLGEANNLQCADIFVKTYKVQEFKIEISGKTQSQEFLEASHSNLVTNTDFFDIQIILRQIARSGTLTITAEQRDIIKKFRQDSSFLRSMFQTSSKEHSAPEDFRGFVRDFGHLKDMVNIDANAEAQKMARKILKKYSDLNIEKLLKDSKPASKKSAKKYFKALIEESRKIMAKSQVTVDEVHDVRKNLRDILRFLQIQNELLYKELNQSENRLDLGQNDTATDTPQIEFLKKTNRKLGEICDHYAELIIKGQIKETSIVQFPELVRPRVEHFLNNVSVEVLKKEEADQE